MFSSAHVSVVPGRLLRIAYYYNISCLRESRLVLNHPHPTHLFYIHLAMHLRKHPSVSLLHAQPPLTNNTYNSQQWHFPNIHQLHQTTNNQLVSSWILACFPTHRRKLTARSLCAPQCHHRYTTHSSHSSRTLTCTHHTLIPRPQSHHR